MFDGILSWFISPCPKLTSGLLKCIRWHIVFNLWQARAPTALNRAFTEYIACNKAWVVDLFGTALPHYRLSSSRLLDGLACGTLSIASRAKKWRRPRFVVISSGVLYPQMRRRTKQASRFKSTAKMSRPSLTNWDLVWPLVFKLLSHVSSNWYLMFSRLASSFVLSPRLILCFVTKSLQATIASVSQSLEQNQSFELPCEGGMSIYCMYNHPLFWTLISWSFKAGPREDWMQIYSTSTLCLSEPKKTWTHSMWKYLIAKMFVFWIHKYTEHSLLLGFKKTHRYSLYECYENCLKWSWREGKEKPRRSDQLRFMKI